MFELDDGFVLLGLRAEINQTTKLRSHACPGADTGHDQPFRKRAGNVRSSECYVATLKGAREGGTRAEYARRQLAALILDSCHITERASVQALPRLLNRR